MALLNIQLTFNSVNVSAQVGDIVYYSVPSPGGNTGSFDAANLASTRFLGNIILINGNTITVQYDDTVAVPPPEFAFISFVKNKKINTSSLLGYYSSVSFVNDSTKKAELFSIGSEISESSK